MFIGRGGGGKVYTHNLDVTVFLMLRVSGLSDTTRTNAKKCNIRLKLMRRRQISEQGLEV